jgi:hypothetical protein
MFFAKYSAFVLSAIALSSSAFGSPIGMFSSSVVFWFVPDDLLDQSEAPPILTSEVHTPSIAGADMIR